jgi:adenosylmethionine-8-amino-7-oxononanoate aminotransferase
LNKTDYNHIWHPYNSLPTKTPIYEVSHTNENYIYLKNGQRLIDGMSSWWSAIWGYNHPYITEKLNQQASSMPHVMFGGLTHKPAIDLANNLLDILPNGLESIFFCDSGSVSVEVALKTAIQYQNALGKQKHTFLSLEHSYHGDTLGAMSVCDPKNSMHSIYSSYLPKHIFTTVPKLEQNVEDIKDLESIFKQHHQTLAGFIVEPIVQGAGGMRVYRKAYLKKARELCDKYDVLLIFDEVATGFGHTGAMFASDFASVIPDIMTIGKSLTAGVMSFASMITTKKISQIISNANPGLLMHGPTFMANPLACSVANASCELFKQYNWQEMVSNIQIHFEKELFPLKSLNVVNDVRVIGNIAVIELVNDTFANDLQKYCVENGVWLRPFGKLLYAIPPYITSNEDLKVITEVMIESVKQLQ